MIKKINKKNFFYNHWKKILLVLGGLFLFVFLVVILMAIFRICPPITSGPQPPWCTNPEFFERDFSLAGLGGALRVKLMNWFPGSDNPESIYDPENDDVYYFEHPSRINDYSLMFGVAPSDFFWPVCQRFSSCIDPRKNVLNTLSRIESIGSDFVVFTDYVRIDDEKNIFIGKASLNQRHIDNKLLLADSYDLETFVLLNLFLDDSSARHMERDDFFENRRFGGSLLARSVDYWDPDIKNMNLLFDNWEHTLIKNLERWSEADYIVVNPEDTTFEFLNHIDIINNRNKKLINLAKENYDGNVCVHFGNLDYLVGFPEIDFYKEADCVIIGGHFSFNNQGVENNVESFKSFFVDYFSHDFFYGDYEVFQMISTMSYDNYIEDQWFEVWDLPFLDLEYESDFILQANSFEGFFRALQEVQPPIKGIFHYGYWWEDVNFDRDNLNVKLMNSIRNKDAEHVFYRWSQVIGT